MKYVAEIPVRIGSKRVIQKNLRLINNKPMVAYSIEAAKESKHLSDIYINSESEILKKLAEEYGVKFYKRKPELAIDSATSDEFNYDFLKNIECDAVVMINPVSPLILPEDIDKAIEYFEKNQLDTLISIKEEKLQTFYQNKPININIDEKLAMTQNIQPVQICAWSVTIWRKESFIKNYDEKGYAVFNGKLGFYPINSLRAIKVSYEEDFRLVEYLIKSKYLSQEPIKYYS